MRLTTVCLMLAACGINLAMSTLETAAQPEEPRAPISEMWAVVWSGGTLARGRGAISSLMVGRGLYEVRFTSPVNDCVYQATLGTPDASTPPIGMIAVAPRAGNSKAVLVRTNNMSGTPFAAGFHLFVSCDDGAHLSAASAGTSRNSSAAHEIEPQLSTNDRWAYVDHDGSIIAHGQGGPAQGDWLGGQGYEVIFDKDIRQCAFLANAILSNTSFPKLTVGVARRARNPNGVLVRMSTFGARFYLVVKCPVAGPRSAMPRAHLADRWAVINSNGTPARGLGLLQSEKNNTGNYFVEFETGTPATVNQPVLVTLGTANARQGLPAAGLIHPNVNFSTPSTVGMNVFTKDASGAPANRPFHVYHVRYPRRVFP